jgi:hypothetical protein
MRDQLRQLLSGHPQWRQLLVVTLLLPLVVLLAVVLFAWPAARISPRELPVGIVGSSATSEAAIAALERAHPDAYDFKAYGDESEARRGIQHRDVYGALELNTDQITVFTATASGSTVARLLEELAGQSAQALGAAAGTPVSVQTVDVVQTDPDDPQGVVLSAALLPLTICSILIATAVALVLEFKPAWRLMVSLTAVSAVAGLGAFLITGPYLSVLPDNGFAAWGSLSLTILAMTTTTAGLICLVGPTGLGLGAALMVFVGNPFSGSTSAPELLPGFAHQLGQWLPPGAGNNLLRSVVYFGGHGAGFHLGVLLAWTAFGLTAILTGHCSFVGFAARRGLAEAISGSEHVPSRAQVASRHEPSTQRDERDAILLDDPRGEAEPVNVP